MLEYDLLEFSEFLEFLEVLVVDDQVEADVGQVHLLDLVVELRPLEHLQGVPEDI